VPAGPPSATPTCTAAFTAIPRRLEDTRQAVRASLTDLQLPVDREEITKEGLIVHSRTGDGRPILIDVETHVAPLPAEGASTSVGVRVDKLGDETVSTRLLNQVDLHLIPAARSAVPASPAPGTTTGRLQPVAAETPAPPLAPPLPAQPIDSGWDKPKGK